MFTDSAISTGKPSVSVVLCTYTEDRWDALMASVESLRRQTFPPAEIIVVVDHNPALLERVQTCMPDVMGLANEQHAGASGSRNTGVVASRGAIVAFLDDDAEAAPNWLGQLCSCYGDPRMLGVGGAITPNWLGKQPAWLPREFLWVVGCTYIGMPARRAPIRNLISANMSVRREVFEALGGFRGGFGDLEVAGSRRLLRAQPPTDEETEFCIRGLQRWPGRYWLHEPRAKVRHRVPEQRTRFRYFLSQCYEEGLGAAIVARSLGREDGLSMERSYALKVLPRGVARGLAEAAIRGDITGLARSTAIVAGLGATLLSFFLGKTLKTFERAGHWYSHGDTGTFPPARPTFRFGQAAEPSGEPPLSGFEPVRIVEVEISRPLPAIFGYDEQSDREYRQALVLVRLHNRPLGVVEARIDNQCLRPNELAERIRSCLGSTIAEHLQRDGFPGNEPLTAAGVAPINRPECSRSRDQLLTEAPFISVIIPTSNRTEQLAVCLRSLFACAYPRFEVIVVDNMPTTTDTADLVRTLSDHGSPLRYAREDRPGSASARNRGLDLAIGDIVAFTDDDVMVDRFWLAELAAAFRAADAVGCVTGLIMPRELETPAQGWFEQYGGFGKGFSRRIYDLKENRPDDPLFPFNAGMFGSGNNMAFTRAVLKELRGFDPMLGNSTPARGGVDIDAFFRTVIRGYKLVYEPAAIVHHAHRRDYAGLRKQIHCFAVGTTAVQTKSLLANPRLLPGFIKMLPAGLRFALGSTSAFHARKQSDYPKELTLVDRKGMLYGPLAYLRSWWWWRVSLPRERYQRRGTAGNHQGAE